MKALILAAGGGSRVRSLAAGRPKCLMPLGERPIIEWVIGALTTAGIRDIVMVTGFKAQVLKRALGNGARLNASLTYVHNRNWRKPNGLSVYAARSILGYKETFLTLMSDHLLPASIIRKVAGAPTTKCLLAVDDNVSGVFDLSDATKVRVVDGSPVTIGKRLRRYNAVDCGLFRFDGRVFTALEAAFQRGRMALTDGVRVLIEHGDLDVFHVGHDAAWIDIDTPRAYRRATADMAVFIPQLGTRKRK